MVFVSCINDRELASSVKFNKLPIKQSIYQASMSNTNQPAVKDLYENQAEHYDKAIGSIDQRSDQYKNFFANVLRQHGCEYVLDVSCGTGVDSAILLDHGFKVVSTDASLHMLKYAKKMKAENAGVPKYDDWIINQAFWETLPEDLDRFLPPGTRFDAVVCLANSIAHVLNDDGKYTTLKKCLRNLAKCLKPGGVLLVDHRNYDLLLDNIQAPKTNVYYKYQNPMDIRIALVMENGTPKMVTSDFYADVASQDDINKESCVRMCHYPHRLSSFSQLLEQAFGPLASHQVFGDFQPAGQLPTPGFYQHVIRKGKEL